MSACNYVLVCTYLHTYVGILSRYLNGDLERIGNGEGTQNYFLQGYAMASGYLLSNDVEGKNNYIIYICPVPARVLYHI